MITFQTEDYENIKNPIRPLIEEHWREIGVFDKEAVPLKPKWDWYNTLNKTKKLHVVTARDDEKLVGYYISIIIPHIHYADLLVAENDVVYLQKEYRKGFIGYNLIKFAVGELKILVGVITLSMKAKQEFSSLAKRLGFELTDYKFTLEI